MNACRTNAKLQPHKGDKLPHLTHTMLRKSLRQQHPNNSKQQWCFGKGWRHVGPSISNRVPRNPAIPLHLQKYCFLVIFRKKGHCSNLISGSVSGLQEVVLPSCVESLLLEQNPSLIYLRNGV